MFKRIVVPVDLAHSDLLANALDTATDLAKHYGAKLIYVSVTAETPTSVAHNPKEFADKLAKFAADRGVAAGIEIESKAYTATDPTIDVDATLLRAAEDAGADLVVIASHKPGFADYFWGSHGGRLASHATISVFVIR
ncbi:universal stress protein [Pararhodobacter sp. SW119]|uniref:universal stress protein n=1 Tax=Pararhodobacter sp. SW119 TaxID=2780075 RepID=UPI001AE06BAE|nr:universal stress protein [Pararhodobacter sp. SW119]